MQKKNKKKKKKKKRVFEFEHLSGWIFENVH